MGTAKLIKLANNVNLPIPRSAIEIAKESFLFVETGKLIKGGKNASHQIQIYVTEIVTLWLPSVAKAQ